MLIKERTVGILGQKGTGKTYLTREMIEKLDKNAIVFDTIGAIKPNNVRMYKVEPAHLEEQAVFFSEIVKHTHKNIGVNLSMLTRDEIVEFTESFLMVSDLKDRYIFIDEMAEYVPQSGTSSKELERLVRNGRNAGNTFIFNTQRPAYITKNILSLVDILIVFRLVWERDIMVIKDILNNLGYRNITGEIRKITNQKTGEKRVYVFAKAS